MIHIVKTLGQPQPTPLIAQIVATDEDGLIGIGDKLPWGMVKEDMAFFKYKTLNRIVVMGYNTILSLPFKLPYRYMVGVCSPCRDTDPVFDSRVDSTVPPTVPSSPCSWLRQISCLINQDDEKTYDYSISTDTVFIAGGGKIYADSLLDTDVVFRNVIRKDKSLYPTEGKKVYYPLEKLKQHFTLVSFEEVPLTGGGYMNKEIWVKPR